MMVRTALDPSSMRSSSPTIHLETLSQAQRERLAFIEVKVYFCCEVRRAGIENRFGIAPAAATRDLTTYRTLAPRNLSYDVSAKLYALGDHFSPLFELSAERALTWLRQGIGEMQMIADSLNLEVRVSASVEATAIGIASLAGVSALGTSFEQLANNWKAEKVYTPSMKEEERRKKLAQWNKALEAVKKFHE